MGTIFVKIKVILFKTVVSLNLLFVFITRTLIKNTVVVIFLLFENPSKRRVIVIKSVIKCCKCDPHWRYDFKYYLEQVL